MRETTDVVLIDLKELETRTHPNGDKDRRGLASRRPIEVLYKNEYLIRISLFPGAIVCLLLYVSSRLASLVGRTANLEEPSLLITIIININIFIIIILVIKREP